MRLTWLDRITWHDAVHGSLLAIILACSVGPRLFPQQSHAAEPSVQPITQPDSVSYFYAPRTTIVDAGLVGKAFVVLYRQASALAWQKHGKVGSVPDRIWQDVYVARGDSIVFEKRIEGRIVPPETVPERIEWGK